VLAAARVSVGSAHLSTAGQLPARHPRNCVVTTIPPHPSPAQPQLTSLPHGHALPPLLLLQLFRGWNALPSLALVLLGAWTGAGKTLLALKLFTGVAGRVTGWRACRRLRLLRTMQTVLLPSPAAACFPVFSR
jgi:hypothetical protein